MGEVERELTAVLLALVHYSEDSGSMLLRNIGRHLPNCASFHPGDSNLQRFGVSENRVPKRIFGSKREGVIGGRRKLYAVSFIICSPN
jgi:hypothetical protein